MEKIKLLQMVPGLKLSAFVHRGGAWYPAHVWKPKLGIHRSSSSVSQVQPPLLAAEKSNPVIPLAVHCPCRGWPTRSTRRVMFCVPLPLWHKCHSLDQLQCSVHRERVNGWVWHWLSHGAFLHSTPSHTASPPSPLLTNSSISTHCRKQNILLNRHNKLD